MQRTRQWHTRSVHGNGALTAVRTSLSEQLASLRGVAVAELPESLLTVAVREVAGMHVLLPADWEALRHEEGGAGRPVPFWARPWPSGRRSPARSPTTRRRAGARVLELGCGLAAPSIVAARAGADVLATDGATDAVAFAAHSLALNEVDGEVAHATGPSTATQLAERGPFDLVLGRRRPLHARRTPTRRVRAAPAARSPRAARSRLADPGRTNARRFLSAARASFALDSRQAGDVTLYRLRPR